MDPVFIVFRPRFLPLVLPGCRLRIASTQRRSAITGELLLLVTHICGAHLTFPDDGGLPWMLQRSQASPLRVCLEWSDDAFARVIQPHVSRIVLIDMHRISAQPTKLLRLLFAERLPNLRTFRLHFDCGAQA